jgi:hypothetical protein
MMIDGKKVVVLYLEDWQKRMVKDFVGIECDRWVVPVVEGEANTMYRSLVPSNSENKRMYLTDWQMKEVKDEVGATCEFVELTKNFINVSAIRPYGVQTE